MSNQIDELLRNAVTQRSRGLGDTVFKFTHALGIDKAAHLFTEITGIDCGCSKRQADWNEAFPYKENEPKP
jgi:hypothetical protein